MLYSLKPEKKSLLVLLFVFLSFASIAKAQTQITEGSLEVLDDKGKPVGLCPLKHTDVKAEVSGFIARVTVTQQFVNPFDKKIEAVYAFPLSERAAVDDMTMIIGDRIIRGKIMKREEAAAVYNQAKTEGKVASLLEQQRPNIFTQHVANIVPNAEVKIVISYVEYLKYDGGSYEFVFPMTIGERYIPASQTNTEDVSKISTPRSERPGHTISLEVKIDAGVPIVSLDSRNHKIESTANYSNESLIRLENQNEIPNKDFVLRYKVAGEKIQDALLTHRDKRSGFFTLILQPPDRVMPADVNPKEIVFVLDTSGSMEGFPIEKSKECMMMALEGLYPSDTFNLITFAGETSILFNDPVPATKENLAKAKKFLASRKSDGGTEMMKAIKAALEPSDAQNHVRIVCFMTDGFVYNDNAIIAEVQKHPNARVFSFGIGASVNRFLLDKIAEEGRGEAEYVSPNDDGSAAAKKFHERIRNPLLTDVAIDWNGLPVADVYPKRNPDLFSAKPVVLSGRFTGSAKGSIKLKGMMAGVPFEREINVELPEQESSNDVLATLWARQRVDDLMKNDYAGTQDGKIKDELKNEITQIGIEFRLLTQFTSFVAVDETLNTGSVEADKVDVPNATPENAPTNNVVGTTTETVTVTSESSLASSSVSSSITQKAVIDLPLQARNPYTLVGLRGNTSTSNQSKQSKDISINGQRTSNSTIQIDGSDSVDGFTAGNGQSTPFDAVSEINIVTSNYKTEYGRSSGSVVNVVTKAGTNKFHGSLFEHFGNGVLNSNSFFANSRGLKKPSGKLNIFGGTLGGPIRRDRNFFFVAYEGLQMRQPAFALTEVPSLASRLSAPLNLQPLFNAFPIPNGANTANGFSEVSSNFINPVSHNAFNFRHDWNLTDSLNFSTRYNFANSKATTRSEDGFALNTQKRVRDNTNTLTNKLTYVLSSTVVTEIQAHYNRAALNQFFFLDNFGGANTQGLSTTNRAFTKFDFFGKNAALASGQETEDSLQQLEINNDWDVISGEHAFAFGFNYRHQRFTVGTQPTEQNVLFSGANLLNANAAERVNSFSRVSKLHPRFNTFSLYAQDSWRISPRLTFNYGLRWELNPPPSNSDNLKPLAITNTNQPFSFSNNSNLWQTTYSNFAPRVSFAWDIFGNDKTVLHSGFGLYYDMDGTANVLQVFKDSFPFVGGAVAFSNNPTTTNNLFIGFDPKLKLPYTRRWGVSLDRKVFDKGVLSFAYMGSQGRRLFLTKTLLNQNQNFPLARLTTNEGESDYQAFQTQYTSLNLKGFTAILTYTFAKSLDNFSPDSPFEAIMVSANPQQDRGVSDFDTRHTFNGMIVYSTPNEFANKKLSLLMRKWSFSSLLNLRTALPLNVVYGRVNNFGVAYWRPDLSQGVQLYLTDANIEGNKRINPSAFVIPGVERQGTLGRNSLRGFPLYQFDFAVSRQFNLTQDLRLTLKVSAINVLNHPNFAAPAGNDLSIGSSFPSGVFLTNPTFGKTTSLLGSNNGASLLSLYQQSGARIVQASFRLEF